MRRLLLTSLAAAAAALFSAAPARAQLQAPPPIQQGGPGMTVDQEQLQRQQTNRKLDEAESQDSKRNFELFWADIQAGGSYVDMGQFSSDDFAIRKSTAGGPSFGVGAGVRLLVFYAGARLRYHPLSLFNLWQVNAELGIKIPIRSLDFMAGIHGGYSFVGALSDSNRALSVAAPVSNDDVTIRGANLGADVAVDYYLTPLFSVGVGVIGDVLLLSRPGIERTLAAGVTREAIDRDGSSAGLQLGALLRLGLHLGL